MSDDGLKRGEKYKIERRGGGGGPERFSWYSPGGYELVDLFPSRGFSNVYKAAHRDDKNKLAIVKEFMPSALTSRNWSEILVDEGCEVPFEWGRKRFKEEARILAKFDHPSIVRVIDIVDSRSVCVITEYVDGQSLLACMTALERPVTQDEVDAFLRPVLSALNVIHAEGIIHGDLSPDNIQISKDDVPVLLDFGAAKSIYDVASESAPTIVKRGYSPVEQYSFEPVAPRPSQDIYAMGATLYHLLTGVRPPESIARAVEDTLAPIETAAQGKFRAGFLEAITHALAIEPEARPQSIEEWEGALFAADSALAAEDAAAPRGALGLFRDKTYAQIAQDAQAAAEPKTSDASAWGCLAFAGLLVLGLGWLILR